MGIRIVDYCKLLFGSSIVLLELISIVKHVDNRMVLGNTAILIALFVYDYLSKKANVGE